MSDSKEPGSEAPRTPPRRTHAERRAETKSRIKSALVESISELGFHRTTAAEISRRAGTSWGAAQHHFGDKNGILMAVLVDSFNLLVTEFEGLPREDAPLTERVDQFIESAWSHVRSPHYRSTFEILLNLSVPEFGSEEGPLRMETLQVWDSIWTRFFPEADLAPRDRITLQYYVISALSGLAAFRKFGAPTDRQERDQLRFLKDTLARELKAAA